MKRIIRILPHVTIILSIMFVVLWVLDQINPRMNFLDSDLSKILLFIFCLSSLLTSIVYVAIERHGTGEKIDPRKIESDLREDSK